MMDFTNSRRRNFFQDLSQSGLPPYAQDLPNLNISAPAPQGKPTDQIKSFTPKEGGFKDILSNVAAGAAQGNTAGEMTGGAIGGLLASLLAKKFGKKE